MTASRAAARAHLWARAWELAYSATTDRERRAGAGWYGLARAWVYVMAHLYGRPESVVAGVVAALSPRQSWYANRQRARAALETGVAVGLFSGQAERILGGEPPLEVLQGPKVRAFYRALMGDNSAGVIDSHMRQSIGERPRAFEDRAAYREGVRALRAAAKRHGVPVCHLQGAIWVRQRGRAT